MGMSCAGQERMAELETPEGAEQAKHSSRKGTQGSVDGVQRKEHLRETETAARSSQEHGMDWLGRDLKDHLLPTPLSPAGTPRVNQEQQYLGE